ncbi:hypothetical protein GCM10022224_084170 [Nonomuraea antimicrobica]|uniref:Uncharacterized protein n=1 Tax=Nonomuraea antimicrobica TaxID=561173 RepID=A0ABP7DKZ7_9ACTN
MAVEIGLVGRIVRTEVAGRTGPAHLTEVAPVRIVAIGAVVRKVAFVRKVTAGRTRAADPAVALVVGLAVGLAVGLMAGRAGSRAAGRTEAVVVDRGRDPALAAGRTTGAGIRRSCGQV